MFRSSVAVVRVTDETTRELALQVLRATYLEEKGWVCDAESQLPRAELYRSDVSWFLALIREQPVGVLRVVYDPPIAQYANYNIRLLDPSINVNEFLQHCHIAEIGRFAVMPDSRSQLVTAVSLMRAATTETVERGYTHYITDVFEDDPHSPYGFHTRVMGFTPVATHDYGELNSRSRRITLVLDLKAAYKRLKMRGNWIFRFLTSSWSDALHRRLAV